MSKKKIWVDNNQLSLFPNEIDQVSEKITKQDSSGRKEKKLQNILHKLIALSEIEKRYKYGAVDLYTISCVIEIKSGKHGEPGINQLLKSYVGLKDKNKIFIVYLFEYGDMGKAPEREGKKRKKRTGMTSNEKAMPEIMSLLSQIIPNLLFLTERVGHEEEDRRKNIETIRKLDVEYIRKQDRYHWSEDQYIYHTKRKEYLFQKEIN